MRRWGRLSVAGWRWGQDCLPASLSGKQLSYNYAIRLNENEVPIDNSFGKYPILIEDVALILRPNEIVVFTNWMYIP